MTVADTFHTMSAQMRRGFGAAAQRTGNAWRSSRAFRWLTIAVAVLLVMTIALWITLTRDLPDAQTLVDYQPALPSIVRGVDGEIVHRFERERRVQLQYGDLPPNVIRAFLAAEDKTFFSHGGVDFTGTANAAFDFLTKFGSDDRAVGGSTITQQVAKNVLLSNEYSVTRKLKEMILAGRIEDVLTKPEILTLYLNEIPLGRRSFGVQAAARAYFDKDIDELDLHEVAFLAILPKAPERYGRAKNESLALERRNFVLDQMAENEFVDTTVVASAKRQPLGLILQQPARTLGGCGFLLRDRSARTDGPLWRNARRRAQQRIFRGALDTDLSRQGNAGRGARCLARRAVALPRRTWLERAGRYAQSR